MLASRLGFRLAGRFPRVFLRLGAARDRPALGLLGEALAARELGRRGARVLGHRVRTRHGEVDLLVLDGAALAAVEVKAGRLRLVPGGAPDLRWRPGLRVDARRLARLLRCAAALARELGLSPRRVRVDLVEVLLEPLTGDVRFLLSPDLRRPLSSEPDPPLSGTRSRR